MNTEVEEILLVFEGLFIRRIGNLTFICYTLKTICTLKFDVWNLASAFFIAQYPNSFVLIYWQLDVFWKLMYEVLHVPSLWTNIKIHVLLFWQLNVFWNLMYEVLYVPLYWPVSKFMYFSRYEKLLHVWNPLYCINCCNAL